MLGGRSPCRRARLGKRPAPQPAAPPGPIPPAPCLACRLGMGRPDCPPAPCLAVRTPRPTAGAGREPRPGPHSPGISLPQTTPAPAEPAAWGHGTPACPPAPCLAGTPCPLPCPAPPPEPPRLGPPRPGAWAPMPRPLPSRPQAAGPG